MEFKTLIDLVTNLRTEKDCHHYLASQWWNDGVITCPHCANERAYIFKDGIRYKCTSCRMLFTVKTGTFMEASKLPTIKWLVAMWLVLHKAGISSVQLSKDLGVTQKTSWFMLQRIRVALGNEDNEPLYGEVEIDETFIGGKNQNRHKVKRITYKPGRSWSDKIPVFGMLQRSGRLVATSITDVSMLAIKKTVENNIEQGSVIMADGFTGYKPLRLRYDLKQVDHAAGCYVKDNIHTNSLESAWCQLKRCIRGNYTKMTKKHIDKYLNEFVFRYNNRNLAIPKQMECVIARMNIRTKYKELTAA